MPDAIDLPAMGEAQKQSWHALMDVYDRIDSGWALVGGQLVHLHCAERGRTPTRPTNDVDTVVDIRSSPGMLETFTAVLHMAVENAVGALERLQRAAGIT